MKTEHQRLERIERCLYLIAHGPDDCRELAMLTRQMVDESDAWKRHQDAVTESMGINKKEPGDR